MAKAELSSKWSFLRSNKFFTATSFSGWSFIGTASTKIEIVFWYMLLSVFAVITIYNVAGVIGRYHSHPSEVTVEMVNTIKDVQIGNISLTFTFGLAEFYPFIPLKWNKMPTIYNYDFDNPNSTQYKETSSSALKFLACEAANPRKADHYLSSVSNDDIKFYWFEKLLNWIEPINTFGTDLANYTIGDERILDDWAGFNNIGFNYLSDFLNSYRVKFGKMTDAIMDDLYYDVARFVLWQRVPFKLEYFFTLHAIKSGIDPRMQLFDSMMQKSLYPRTTFSDEAQLQMAEQFEAKQLNPKYAAMFGNGSNGFLDSINTTSFHVFQWAMAGLNEFLHFSTGTPNTTFFLSDFSYSLGHGLNRDRFHLNVDVKVPPATKNLTIAIYSMFMARFEVFFEALLETTTDDLEYSACEGLEAAAVQNDLHKLLWDYGYHSFLTIYDYADLVIETGDGSTFRLEPLYKYKLNLKTNIRFASQIQNCYVGSFKECNNKCINDQYLEHCNCYPWTLYYLNEHQVNMCDRPCSVKGDTEIKEECQDTCGQMLKHPCSSYNFFIEQKEAISDIGVVRANDTSLPLYVFTIAPAMRNYPQIVERYSMSANVLAGELGGQLELWMGINIIGLIHLLVYIIKQINNTRHPHTKTGRIIRSLFGKTNNDVEPEDETNPTSGHRECLELTNQSRLVALQLNVDQLTAQNRQFKQENRQFQQEIQQLQQQVNTITADMKVIKNLIEKQP